MTSERLLPHKPVRTVREHVAACLADFAFRQSLRDERRRRTARRARPAPHEVQLALALDAAPLRRIVVRVLDPKRDDGEDVLLECGHDARVTGDVDALGGVVLCLRCIEESASKG